MASLAQQLSALRWSPLLSTSSSRPNTAHNRHTLPVVCSVALSNAQNRERLKLKELFEQAYERCRTAPMEGVSFTVEQFTDSLEKYDFDSEVGTKVEEYICVRETAPQKSVAIIDMNMPKQPLRRPITADSALMNPNSRILALKAPVPGTTQDHLQVFNIEMKAKMKSRQMTEQVVFWKWITPNMIGIVTPKETCSSSLWISAVVSQENHHLPRNKQICSSPPDFADDFPVSMQISNKYGLIYVITKLGLLFVYDLETATAIYRNRISPDPIFFTSEASSVGGFYAINRRGQVLLATVNESSIVPFVSGQLNNLELAVNLAKRGNLLSVPVQAGQTPPLLQFFGTLLTRGKLNSFESLELSRLVVNQNKKNLLENWLAEDKLECSEELGDLVKVLILNF
ncbi:hypothetical protein PIB30_022404 [Stylosanthes scabra]|uniref:Clathrin heavy chain linker core motif domain-containing protein n=1 Tax=Stylosanthes scabra TaxID=79078 RepID=A0ABU6Z6P8_9FABA|nr:hypothetical protein [Stylosanthes scabra]